MSKPHQTAPWEWSLDGARATRLRAAPRARWLQVTAGRVWLTRTGCDDDVWLAAGEHLCLPPGSDWVAEGWPSARAALLEASQSGA